jgi:hypothetical protein
MKLAIMQPYAFPYLGYFQLINAVDLFVLYDDAAFIKQGWINRNVLGARHGPQRFTLPVCRPRLGQPISEITLYRPEASKRRLLATIESLYRRAPYYQRARPVLEAAIGAAEENLALYIKHGLEVLNTYLGIKTGLVRSSERHAGLRAKGEARVIEICRAEGAGTYINAEGGRGLYDEAAFQRHGIELRFLMHEPRPYPQNRREFMPRLSVIDAMMFNGPDEIAGLLAGYRLVKAPQGDA